MPFLEKRFKSVYINNPYKTKSRRKFVRENNPLYTNRKKRIHFLVIY